MPKHVKEAYRLLNKSIIRVDQPDIHLDDDEANEEMEIDEPGADGDTAAAEPVRFVVHNVADPVVLLLADIKRLQRIKIII